MLVLSVILGSRGYDGGRINGEGIAGKTAGVVYAKSSGSGTTGLKPRRGVVIAITDVYGDLVSGRPGENAVF